MPTPNLGLNQPAQGSFNWGVPLNANFSTIDGLFVAGPLLDLSKGGTKANLSATGGPSKFLRQNSAGGAVDVVQPSVTDLSDGSTGTGAVVRAGAPTFTGAPVLPSFTVAALPAAPGAGALAYATNGRKVGEGAGAGTGVPVYFSNAAWRVFATDAAVAS